jgi:hypothetical protein
MEKLYLGLKILAGFIFLFQSFRLLKEDYSEEQIIKASLLGIILSFGSDRLTGLLNLESNVLGLILSTTGVVYILSLFADWRFWTVMEKLTWPGLVSLSIIYAGQLHGIIYLAAVLANFFWRNYRSFRWYPSGKVGFFFLINLIFVALFSIGLDFWYRRLVELFVWSVILVAGISGIILLSGREKNY